MKKVSGIHTGIVTNNNDEDNLGRVKFKIPGLVEPESLQWAWPAGVGGGPNRANWEIPDIGHKVFVTFLNEDFRHPIYFHGPWSIGETPDQNEDSVEIKVIRYEDFYIQFDDRSGNKKLVIKDLNTDNEFKFDSENSDCVLTVNNDYNITITNTKEETIEDGDANQTVQTGDKNDTISTGDYNETITSGDKNITTGSGSWLGTIADSISWTIASAINLSISATGYEVTSTTGTIQFLLNSTAINLVNDASSIVVSPASITIASTNTNINGTATVNGALTVAGAVVNLVPGTPVTIGQPGDTFIPVCLDGLIDAINNAKYGGNSIDTPIAKTPGTTTSKNLWAS